MRTTVDLNDELFRQVKSRATADGTSFKQIVEAALRTYLGSAPRAKPYRLKWRTEAGGLQPGIDLSDWSTVKRALNDDLDKQYLKEHEDREEDK